MDAIGNLFIADWSNNSIRKVGANGVITTVAGNGMVGYSGDDDTLHQCQPWILLMPWR